MSSDKNIVLVGLPNSGKTTYLSALWHQLESGEMSTALTADRLQSDREYLNTIRNLWLKFETIPRTPSGTARTHRIHLKHSITGEKFDLTIPEVAGEYFVAQWYDRRVSAEYVERVTSANGVMLFLHSQELVHPSAVVRPVEAGEGGPSEKEVPTTWTPSAAPTQVRVVDLLQTILSILEERRGIRVAMVVSAWDRVEERYTPWTWLEDRMPLLYQFVRANIVRMSTEVFGVSAIGGDLSDREALAMAGSASGRPRILVGANLLSDLTIPLEYLTETGG